MASQCCTSGDTRNGDRPVGRTWRPADAADRASDGSGIGRDVGRHLSRGEPGMREDATLHARQVIANGLPFHVIEQGTGPAVLFCHGFPDTAETWRDQMRAVAGAGYRALARDMRGYGDSYAPEDPSLYSALHTVGVPDTGADPRRVVGLMKGTPLHEASYHGHAGVVRALTETSGGTVAPSVELDAQGPYNGLTALHDAVWHGHEEAARALVEAGARLDLRTHSGLTPRDMALRYGYDTLAQLLFDAARA
jgi:hypothetical protein